MTAARVPQTVSQPALSVLDAVEVFVRQRAASVAQRRSLVAAVDGLRHRITRWGTGADGRLLFVHVPLLVHAGLGGERRNGMALAVVTTLLFLGLDLFDDVSDGDWPADGSHEGDVGLTAATLLCALPQLALADLDAPPIVVAAMQRTLAAGLLTMSAGQQQDLVHAGASTVSADAVESSVAAKSGEEVATFAGLAAQLANATAPLVDTCSRLGRSLGTAAQLVSDCHELFLDPAGRDFVHGARTLPVALALERLAGADRSKFVALLERARCDTSAREDVRVHLRASGALRQAAFVVEVHRQRALRLCGDADLLEPARTGLCTLIDNFTFFPAGGTP